jgi:hypothetical protein
MLQDMPPEVCAMLESSNFLGIPLPSCLCESLFDEPDLSMAEGRSSCLTVRTLTDVMFIDVAVTWGEAKESLRNLSSTANETCGAR